MSILCLSCVISFCVFLYVFLIVLKSSNLATSLRDVFILTSKIIQFGNLPILANLLGIYLLYVHICIIFNTNFKEPKTWLDLVTVNLDNQCWRRNCLLQLPYKHCMNQSMMQVRYCNGCGWKYKQALNKSCGKDYFINSITICKKHLHGMLRNTFCLYKFLYHQQVFVYVYFLSICV